MDLSNVTYDRKEYLLLSITKQNQETVKHHKKRIEYITNKQSQFFLFDAFLQLNEKWMMRVTSLEVLYKTVYKITPNNNKLEVVPTYEQLIEHRVDIVLVENIKSLF